MNKVISESIVLSRINYGDNDRIVTVITRDQGKIRLIAKGSRKLKSKLAAGIELFSVSEISFIKGKGDIDTLVSSRGIEYFINIQKDLDKIKLVGTDLAKLPQFRFESPPGF
ncbi:DNA repair protein RecO [bacterium]|nr:DNA repair protein RecO [bacterium]